MYICIYMYKQGSIKGVYIGAYVGGYIGWVPHTNGIGIRQSDVVISVAPAQVLRVNLVSAIAPI